MNYVTDGYVSNYPLQFILHSSTLRYLFNKQDVLCLNMYC